MKARVNFRALCPYFIDNDGKEFYHWYTEEYETDEIKTTDKGVEIHVPHTKEWHSFNHEQINLLTITE